MSITLPDGVPADVYVSPTLLRALAALPPDADAKGSAGGSGGRRAAAKGTLGSAMAARRDASMGGFAPGGIGAPAGPRPPMQPRIPRPPVHMDTLRR